MIMFGGLLNRIWLFLILGRVAGQSSKTGAWDEHGNFLQKNLPSREL
jgi:hypothetical protein